MILRTIVEDTNFPFSGQKGNSKVTLLYDDGLSLSPLASIVLRHL